MRERYTYYKASWYSHSRDKSVYEYVRVDKNDYSYCCFGEENFGEWSCGIYSTFKKYITLREELVEFVLEELTEGDIIKAIAMRELVS